MPEEPQTVVVNTTPIIALSLLNHLDLLQALYGQILIPPAVSAETRKGGAPRPGITELEKAEWIQVVPLKDPGRADLLSDLDRGEAEVLALAQELKADLVLIDERLARRHARRLGIPLSGTLGVLLKAKQQRLISEVLPLARELQRRGIRLSKTVVEEVLKLAGEG